MNGEIVRFFYDAVLSVLIVRALSGLVPPG